jgi:hypothetical protein
MVGDSNHPAEGASRLRLPLLQTHFRIGRFGAGARPPASPGPTAFPCLPEKPCSAATLLHVTSKTWGLQAIVSGRDLASSMASVLASQVCWFLLGSSRRSRPGETARNSN